MFVLTRCIVFLLVIMKVEMHTYHLGTCPTIEPQQDFVMNRFLGIWYVIEKTSTGSSCIIYNITKTTEPEQYKLDEINEHSLLALTMLRHGYHYTGTLKVIDSAIPGKMTVKFPLSVAGSSTFTVFTTDYETHAGIFTCQDLAYGNRQSATILSRERTLDKMYIDKIRIRLSNNQINPFDLSLINQKNCPRNLTDGYININGDTVSAHAAADVIRKAGSKIGDGVEYVSGKVKVAYNKLGKGSDEIPIEKLKDEKDAEWLP